MRHKSLRPVWLQTAAYATTASVVVTTVLTIVAEEQLVVFDWLQHTFTQHWVGKGIIAVITFLITAVVCRWLPFSHTEATALRAVRITCWVSSIATLGLVIFFIFFSA